MTLDFSLPWLLLLCGAFPAGLHSLRAQSTAETNPPAAPGRQASAAPLVVGAIPYVHGGGTRQQLDLYLPAPRKEQPLRPVVIWLHGGGWEGGSRHNCPAQPLVGRGYAVASVDYRLSTDAVYPAQIEDCKAAVRWLRAHAAEYHLDPARIGVWGASAGGHLAALLGTTAGTRRFDVGGNLDQSSGVRCVLDWFGPADFLHWGDPPADLTRDTSQTALARLIGGSIHTHAENARAASPLYFVDEHSAPFLILHGDRDGTVPLQQSTVLDAALRKAGVESTLKVLRGASHGGPEFLTPENLQLMAGFFDRHLRPGEAL